MIGVYIIGHTEHRIKWKKGKSTYWYTFRPSECDLKDIEPGDEIEFGMLEVKRILQKAKK